MPTDNKKVSSQVSDIIHDFKTQELEIVKGYKFNQFNNVVRINLYLNQQFVECSNPDAIFWDLSTSRITHTAKNIDLDTKDLMPFAIGETNMFQVWIARVKIRKWLRENKLAILLDDLTDGVAAFGSAVWKITKHKGRPELEEVNLKNLYFDQTAERIRDVPIVELHYLSPLEVRRKKGAWEDDKVTELLNKTPDEEQGNNYEIWEFTGETEEEKPRYVHQIGHGYGDAEIILFEEETTLEKNPYRDFHIGKYRGRWQRIGIVERLYKLQERTNTIVNQNAQATEIASLLLLRSEDSGTNNNVLEQAVNGQIIKSKDMEQIGIDNRAFTVLLNELQTIEAQADKLSLTPEVIQGEALPSGTPFRSQATLINAAKGAFKSTRDRIATELEHILRHEILPATIKNWQKSELEQIAEHADDIKFYDDSLKQKREIEALAKGNRAGRVVTPKELAGVSDQVEQEVVENGRTLKIPDNYFNFDFGLRFIITSESYDKAQQNDAMMNALTLVLQNPGIINIPLFKQFVENNGIEWWRLTPREVQELAQTAGAIKPLEPKQDKLLAQVDSQ